MRASPSSFSNSANATSLNKRLKTIFKKAYELSTLCEVEVCVMHYGTGGKLKTWPEKKEKVRDMALRYVTATKRKKTLNLQEVLKEKMKNSKTKNNKKKKKTDLENMKRIKYPDWYPIFDHYSPNKLFQLTLSLEQTLSTLQERLRFVEAQKQRNANLVHQSLTPYSSTNQHHHHQYQIQPFSPSQIPLMMQQKSHGFDQNINNRNFQYPCFFTTQDYQNHLMQQNLSGFDQNITNGNFQHPYFSSTQGYQNHLMQQNLSGFDQNLINRNFQNPCFSSTQDYTALPLVQESELKNHLMQQQELYGSHQITNMCMMSNFTNSNALENPCLSNTASEEFGVNFQRNPYYGDMVGSSSSSQDIPELSPSYKMNLLSNN